MSPDGPDNVVWHEGTVLAEARHRATGGPGATVWLTGLSGSGKSTIASLLEAALIGAGRASYRLDGDNVRLGLNGDLGFTAEDRSENVRRIGEVACLFADAGVVAIVPVISPYRVDRDRVRKRHVEAGLRFVEVFVDTPLEVCEARDPKGLYAKARAGEISGFTGLDDPYETPLNPDLVIDTTETSPEVATERVVALLG
jgi:adenylyl-sulfate kinase